MTSAKREYLHLDDQTCFALYAATNAVVRAYRPMLAELGLTYPQYLVMLALWQDGAMAAHQLAARLQLGTSAITPLVDRLEAAGFLTRTRTPDRRVVTIATTEAGRRLEGEAARAQRAVVGRIGLDEARLSALRHELEGLTARVSAPVDQAWDDVP